MPFGLISEKAAKGWWAEALRLVLTRTTAGGGRGGSGGSGGAVAAGEDQQAESGNGEDEDAEEAEEEEEDEEGEKEKGAGADPVDGRTGDAAVDGKGAELTLPGGRWDQVRRGAAVATHAVEDRSGVCGVGAFVSMQRSPNGVPINPPRTKVFEFNSILRVGANVRAMWIS